MKPEHLYYKEVNAKDGAYYRRWASVYGKYTSELIDTVLKSARHEEQVYNSCSGILHSCKELPHGLVEEAARRCVEMHACKYSYFKKILSTVVNDHRTGGVGKPSSLPAHENIRGKDYYQ